MTDFIPQPYPLWLGECLPGGKPAPAVRVIAWQANENDGTLRPVVVGQGGNHTPACAPADILPGAAYVYAGSPAEASRVAQSAAARYARLAAVASSGEEWPEPARKSAA